MLAESPKLLRTRDACEFRSIGMEPCPRKVGSFSRSEIVSIAKVLPRAEYAFYYRDASISPGSAPRTFGMVIRRYLLREKEFCIFCSSQSYHYYYPLLATFPDILQWDNDSRSHVAQKATQIPREQ